MGVGGVGTGGGRCDPLPNRPLCGRGNFRDRRAPWLGRDNLGLRVLQKQAKFFFLRRMLPVACVRLRGHLVRSRKPSKVVLNSGTPGSPTALSLPVQNSTLIGRHAVAVLENRAE